MGNPLISVIVPVYRAEKYLPRCINSILNQTYKNFELILVDDGSPDNSGKICDDYALKDNRIKVIHKENGGVSSARNAGIDVANGEYINFIDSDDWVPLDSLEILLNAIVENNADLSVGGYESRELKIVNNSLPYKTILLDENFLVDASELKILDSGHFHSSCCKLFKKQIIKSANINFNLSIKQGEDCLFVREYLLNSKKIITLNQNVYYYNLINDFSATKKVFLDMGLWSFDLINSFINLLNKFSVENENRRLLISELVFKRLNFCFFKYTYGLKRDIAIRNINRTLECFSSILYEHPITRNVNDELTFLRKAIYETNSYDVYMYYKKIKSKNTLKIFVRSIILKCFKNIIEKKRDGLI